MANNVLSVEITGNNTDLKRSLEESKAALQAFKKQVEGGSSVVLGMTKSVEKEIVANQKLTQQLTKTKLETAQLTLEKRKNTTAVTAAAGSYREAQQRLTALGKSIREAKGGFDATNPAIKAQIAEYARLNGQLKAFDKTMGNNFRNVGNYPDLLGAAVPQLAGITTGIGAVGAAAQGLSAVFNSNLKISDSIADVQRTTEMTKNETYELTDALKALPTRTPLADLLDIAIIGGQLGIAKSELAGFVQSLDYLGVALAKEIPGGAEVIAESLGKINGVFKVTATEGTTAGVAMQKTGSAILGLGQAGLATGGFLVDFTQRVGGSASVAKIALPNILAYGAALEESGISAEVAGTAMSKLIGELAGKRDLFFDVAKLANANLTLEEFTKTINTDANAALGQFFEGLNAGGSSLTSFYDILTAAEIKSERYRAAILAISGSQERLNELTKISQTEYAKGTNAADQAAIRNLNLAGVFKQLGNEMNNTFISPERSQSIANSIASSFSLIDASTLLTSKIKETEAAFLGQKDEAVNLIGRYKALKEEAGDNAEKQLELNGIVQKLGEIMPGAVTQWDSYGKAMEFSTTAAYSLLAVQQQLLAMTKQQAVEDLRAEYNKNIKQASRNQKTYNEIVKDGASLWQSITGQQKSSIELVNISNLKAVNSLKSILDSGGKLTKEEEKWLNGFEKTTKATESLNNALNKTTKISDGVGKSIDKVESKNKAYWENVVSQNKELMDSFATTDIGNAAWKSLNAELKNAQKNVDLYNEKSSRANGGGSRASGKSQAEIIKEADAALATTQIGAIQGIDADMAKIDDKWSKIYEKINLINNVGLRNQRMEVAKLANEQEKYLKFLEAFAKSPSKAMGSGVTGLSGSLSAAPTDLPNLVNAQKHIARLSKNAITKETKDAIAGQDELSKYVTSSLRRGISQSLNSLVDDLTSLGQKSFEIEAKYNELRKDASEEQIKSLNKMEKLEKKVNNGFTNMLQSAVKNLSSVGANMLTSSLSEGISKGDLSGLSGLFKGDKKAVGYGALGSLAGGIIQGTTSKKSYLGQGLGGALAGAGTGAAIGTIVPVIGTAIGAIAGAIIGGLGGILGASKANKQYELEQLQLAEQRKQTALAERLNALAYSSSIIGQMTNQGIISGVDTDAFGNVIATIKGKDIQLVLDRTKNGNA